MIHLSDVGRRKTVVDPMPKAKSKGSQSKTTNKNLPSTSPKPLFEGLLIEENSSTEENKSPATSLPSNIPIGKVDQHISINERKDPESNASESSCVKEPTSKTSKTQPDVTKQKHAEEIDLRELASVVNDILNGQNQPASYNHFLSILKNYYVRSEREDHLEKTVYHLIQATVAFVRSNELLFDQERLNECYRQRHQSRKTN